MNPSNIGSKVFNAAIYSYTSNGIKEDEIGYGDKYTFFIPKIRRVENVVTSNTIGKVDISSLESHRRKGNEVWLLVDVSVIGIAHETFRNKVDKLQPWIYSEDGRVFFGNPERP